MTARLRKPLLPQTRVSAQWLWAAPVCGGSAYYYCPAGEVDKTCSGGYYRVSEGTQKCSAGSGRSSTTCYSCKPCNWTCPSGYQSSTCGSGYYQTGTKAKYCDGDSSQTNGTCYKCATCNWTCPDGYQSAKCGTGYHETGTKAKYCDGDSSQTNGTCYKCEANSCEYYGYKSSQPSGQTCESVSVKSGSGTKTCYKDCQNKYYTYTLCMDFEDKSYVDSSGYICGFLSLSATTGDNKNLYAHSLDWSGDALGHPVEYCTSVESESPTIVFHHVPEQSNMSCGFTTPADGLVSCVATPSTDGLRQTASKENGAYIDYTYEVIDYLNTHKISVTYRCGKGIIFTN